MPAQDKGPELTREQRAVIALHDELSDLLGGPPSGGKPHEPYWQAGSSDFGDFVESVLTEPLTDDDGQQPAADDSHTTSQS